MLSDSQSTPKDPAGALSAAGWFNQIQRHRRARGVIAALAVLVVLLGVAGAVQARTRSPLIVASTPLPTEIDAPVISSRALVQTQTSVRTTEQSKIPTQSVTTITAQPPKVNPAPAVKPGPIELRPVQAGYFHVVNIETSLNVRSAPGPASSVVGALAAGERHVFSSGNRVLLDTVVWLEIDYGGQEPGWAHSGYLAADTEPGDGDFLFEPSCAFLENDETWVSIRLEIAADESVAGFIERSSSQSSEIQQVFGALGNSQMHLVVVNSDGAEHEERWWFENESIELPDGAIIPLVLCEGY